jgi:hypothetical protein
VTGTKWQRGLVIFSLICAGEAIFTLPYHVTRFFRPTFLEVFDLTATELGVAQSAYGVIAMVAYFFGGPLADRLEDSSDSRVDILFSNLLPKSLSASENI